MPNVTVAPPATIKVRVNAQNPTIRSISYGSKSLKGSSDVVMTGAEDGDVLVYNSANNNFIISPIEMDAGLF